MTDSVLIAVCGSTGADRYSICNGLIGEEFLPENSKILQIRSWSDEINQLSVEVTSIATFDDTIHEIEPYGEEVRKVRDKQFDLMLYCLPVKSARPVIEEDKRAYDELKLALHPSTWDKCIVVLTCADTIVKNCQTRLNIKGKVTRRIVKNYEETIQSWTTLIRQIFGENTPVIPAGSPRCFSILENDESWLSKLFHVVIQNTNDKTNKTLLKMNILRLYTERINTEVFLNRRMSEHPIVVGEASSKIKGKLTELAAGLGAGGAAGAVGASIGATIGALAIGIPSFGVAAGAGLVLGAAVGGGIGVGTGVGVTRAVERSKRKKTEDDDEGLI